MSGTDIAFSDLTMMDDDAINRVEAVLSEDNEEPEYGGYTKKRVHLKVLVPQGIAGALIGKAGKTISDLQEHSGARIKVSQSSDFYPGSSDRTVMISGSISEVLEAQALLWQKILECRKPRFSEEFVTSHVLGRLSVPNECGGLIIGKGGSNIRSLQEESGARVQIASKESNESRITRERIITVSGELEACMKATELIVLKMGEDPSVTYQNRTTSYGLGSGRVAGTSGNMPLPSGAETISATSTITMHVPDHLVGHILGKRGATMREIQHMSGAKVVVSNRVTEASGDTAQHNADGDIIRTVTITGTPQSAQMAQFSISQKLQLAQNGVERR